MRRKMMMTTATAWWSSPYTEGRVKPMMMSRSPTQMMTIHRLFQPFLKYSCFWTSTCRKEGQTILDIHAESSSSFEHEHKWKRDPRRSVSVQGPPQDFPQMTSSPRIRVPILAAELSITTSETWEFLIEPSHFHFLKGFSLTLNLFLAKKYFKETFPIYFSVPYNNSMYETQWYLLEKNRIWKSLHLSNTLHDI